LGFVRLQVLRAATGVCLAALLAAGGCSLRGLRLEKQGRADLGAAQSSYRPGGAKPALPPLTADSPLADLMQYALLNSPAVESAFYEWKAAVEEVSAANSLPDPMLNLSAEITGGLMALKPALMSGPTSMWPGPGKLALRTEAAYADALARRAVFEDRMLATALEVKRAYYQLWTLGEELKWTREALDFVNDIEQLALQNLAVGKVTQQDVLRAQMERDQIRNRLASLEDSRRPLLARLRSALGLGPEAPLADPAPRLEPGTGELTEGALLEAAFERNPRLKQMRSEVQRAQALYGLARKGNVPDFSWGLETDVKAVRWPIMPSLGVTLPVWRRRIAAEIARESAGVGAARARLSAEELDLAVRFAETTFAWREANRSVALYGGQLLPKAKAARDSARAGYAAGLSSFLDLLEAERTLLDDRIEYAVAQGRREIALAETSLMILGLWPEDVQQILPPQGAPTGPSNPSR
jgi:outer membrane protein TolC